MRNALEGDISDPILDGNQYVVAYLKTLLKKENLNSKM